MGFILDARTTRRKKEMSRLYIKDLSTGDFREYGSDQHDSLVSLDGGKTLQYLNLQNGDGSGEHGLYGFCDKDGALLRVNDIGGEFANIGGFDNHGVQEEIERIIKDIRMVGANCAIPLVHRNLLEDCCKKLCVFGGSRIEKTTEEERMYLYVNGHKLMEDLVHKMKESECTTEEMDFYKMLEDFIKK